jgi:hypothetical protein
VIIKRKKIIKGGGHHGGAWKVAYADFVTAMMAFFMLMWLLNATTEKQRKGLADYFNPTIPINRVSGGGEGFFGGDNVFSEEVFSQSGTGAACSTQRQPPLFGPDDEPRASLRALMPPIVAALALVENPSRSRRTLPVRTARRFPPGTAPSAGGSTSAGCSRTRRCPARSVARITGFADREPVAADAAAVPQQPDRDRRAARNR